MQYNIEYVDPKSLTPRPNNRNKHPKEQIERLMKIIEYQGFRRPIVVSNRSGWVVCGHGRLEAAKKLKMSTVPVIWQDYEDEDQEYADHVADNSLQEWADLDLSGINSDLASLAPDFDIDLLGIKDFVLDLSDLEDNPYTRKVESPIYEPTGERPRLKDIFSTEVTDKLLEKIEKSTVSEEIKYFLRLAAHRHTRFNYKLIAELYAHSDKETQLLMEDSALVVIDFQKAIELGFVKLGSDLKEVYLDEKE